MASDDRTHPMEWDTAQRILRIGMVISFLVAALGIVGEILGWWNDIGELLTTTGTLGGLILGATSIIGNASRTQVHGVATEVHSVADGVERANETLGETNAKLEKLDTIDAKLDKLDDLDQVQLELDKQTGVLDRQVGLLTEIRDRL